jgi:hypothetical protein
MAAFKTANGGGVLHIHVLTHLSEGKGLLPSLKNIFT